MDKFDNKVTGSHHDICFFSKEMTTHDSTRNGLVRAQSLPVVRVQAATLWPGSSCVEIHRNRCTLFCGYDVVFFSPLSYYKCGVCYLNNWTMSFFNLSLAVKTGLIYSVKWLNCYLMIWIANYRHLTTGRNYSFFWQQCNWSLNIGQGLSKCILQNIITSMPWS